MYKRYNIPTDSVELTESLQKTAGLLDSAGKILGQLSSVDAPSLAMKAVVGVPATIMAGGMLKHVIEKIKNDVKRRMVFARLAEDPELSKVDKNTLLQWYATVTHFAPTLAADYLSVKSLMKQFAMFGNIDLQTLKTLAEIEEKQTTSGKNTADIFKNLLR